MTSLLAAAVGLILLSSGVLKAVDAVAFRRQLSRYGLIPWRILGFSAVAAIVFECSLGTALVVQWWPRVVIPIAAGTLLLLAVVTMHAARKQRIEDCGCYGGVIVLSPIQSVLADAAYIAALAIAWWFAPQGQQERWRVAIVIGVAVVVAVATAAKRGSWIDLSRLKSGARWNRRWLSGSTTDFSTGSHFIVFLSRECPWCKRWVPLLNVLGTQADLPRVTGVMQLADAEVAQFRDEHLARFPIARMERKLWSAMVQAVPTATLVENGRIVQTWEGRMPEEFMTRLQNFFSALEPKKQNSRFAG